MTLPRANSRRFARISLIVAVVASVLPFGASPALAAGNQAVSLPGTAGSYVDLGASSSSLGANQFTLELWFKRTATGVTTATGSTQPGLTSVIPLITKGRSEADATNVDIAYFLGINTASGGTPSMTPNTLAADFEDGASSPTPGVNHGFGGTTVIPLNVWEHAALTYDGAVMRIYLNGQLEATSPAINQPPRADSIHKVGLGTAFNSTGVAAGAFAGQMDEVRIWNVARTQAQIQSTIDTEITSGTGLTARLGMNEGSGTTTTGSVGGINGALVGTTGWAAGASMLDPVAAPTGGNNGLWLDGVDDAVNLGAGGGSPLGATQFTLELWFKQMGGGQIASTGTGGITTAVPLITKGRSENDGTNVDTNYFLGINAATGTLAADFEDLAASNNNHPVLGTTAITQNVWHHAAATYNGAQFCLYLDGTLNGTCVATTAVPRSDSIQIPAIGTAYDSTGASAGRFAGMIDEVRIWNVARTQAEIQNAMNFELVSPMSGLLGRWGLNAGSGTTAANTAGSAGVNGTLMNGAAWTTGAPGVAGPPPAGNYAVQFDGANDQVDLGAPSASALGASQYTLELWFKQTGAGTIAQTSSSAPGLTSVIPLITKGRSEADATNVDINYFLGIDTVSGKLAADFEEGSGGATPGANHGFIANTVVTQNVWHHAAVTYDGSVFRMYLDGALDGTSAAINQPPRSDSIDKVGIGVAFNSTGVPAGAFAGTIDEVRIWNVARSLAQIQGAMGSEITTGQANLLGRWGMNDGFWINAAGTGTTINGTLINGPTWVAGTTFTVPNQAPVVDSVVINQATPHTNDTLSATVTSHDPNGDPLTTNYQWTKNGVDIPGPGGTGATLDLSAANNGNKNDLIRVRVTVSDASLTSAPVTSSPVTILNTAPSATVALDDHSPGTNATLTATATSADVDNDTVSLTYVWKVDGITRQTTTTTSLTDTFDLSLAGNGNNGQTVAVTVTPNDGTVDGAPVIDSATVGNAAPVVDSVVIDQASPHTNDTLSATVTAHDPDGDALTYDYQWTRNGSDIATATDPTLDLSVVGDKGDLIRVRVRASDGTATSAPVTSSPVTILNTAPSATVALDDHSPGTNATLTATATSADVDNDTVSLTYVWKVDGITRQTTTTTSLTDTFDLSLAGNGNNGQTVAVTVTPNDGTVDGAPVIDSATVGNAAPVVDSVVIDQASPHTNDTLSATVTAHDPDGDALTYDYQWTKNGVDIPGPGGTGATLDLSAASNGDKGDLIRVRVTVSDASLTSAPVTSSPVTVLNTAPTATVTLDDQTPDSNQILTATATKSDVDVDPVELTYVWTVNGATKRTQTTTSLSDTFDLSVAGNGDGSDTIVVTVTPNDGTVNGTPASDTAIVNAGAAPPIFSDDFSSGNFAAWTNATRVTIDGTTGSPAAPSARAQVAGQSAFAYRDLAQTYTQVCMSSNVNLASSGGTAIDLLRLRTATNGPLIKLFVHTTGTLRVRSEFAGVNFDSGVALGAGWHNVELCGTIGTGTTWDVYRDGIHIVTAWATNTGTTPIGRIQIGDNAVKTFTLNFDHVMLDQTPGETQAPDVSPPTTPGQPTGTSPVAGAIQIDWAASTDDTPPITYRIYRDGGLTPIGSTTATTFTDAGLTPGSSHTYTVDAIDAVNPTLPSAMSPASASILVSAGSPAIFADDFSSGTFANWTTVTRLTIDSAIGGTAPPSARAQVSGLSAFAYHTLGGTYTQACVSMNVNVASGTGIDLFRLRTAANGAIVRVVLVNAARNLQIRSDVGSTTFNSGVALGTGWHNVELCGTVGGATSWDLYRDGAHIVTSWVANTGTTPIGRIQIGDTSASTFTANFDDVIVDQSPGNAQAPDTTPPTMPGQPTGSSPAAGTIQIDWAASSDDSPPITYRIYRDGVSTPIASTTATTFTDTGLTPGNSHTYTVDAIDAVNPSLPSAMSPPSASILVSAGTPPIFFDDFSSGDFSNWTIATRLTIDGTAGSPAIPSARAQVTGLSAYAARDLSQLYPQACFSANVNVASGTGIDLLRLRTALNGPIVRVVLVNAAGKLQIRSDVSSALINSGVVLGAGWHTIELCGTVGNATSWDLYRDGVRIVTAWVADTGTTPIGRIQIGDTSASTFTANFDDVRLDEQAG